MAAIVIVPAIAAFLAGAHLGPIVTGAVQGEAVAFAGYADVKKACPYAQPAADAALVLARVNHKVAPAGVVRIAAVVDALCLAVQRPDNPVNQALAVRDVLRALQVANKQIDPNAPAAPANWPPPPCDRNRCP